MSTGIRVAMGGAVVGLTILALTASPLLAQTRDGAATTSPAAMSGATPTHEQMHQMMDAMHGEGTSERMHEAMVQDAETMMDQCAAMMGMMQSMPGMMGGEMPAPMPAPAQVPSR